VEQLRATVAQSVWLRVAVVGVLVLSGVWFSASPTTRLQWFYMATVVLVPLGLAAVAGGVVGWLAYSRKAFVLTTVYTFIALMVAVIATGGRF
jgi:hypothetical protein